MLGSGVGLVYDQALLDHDAGPVPWGPPGIEWPFQSHAIHWESPERIARVWELLVKGDLIKMLIPIKATEATVEELRSVHTEAYIASVRALDEAGGGDAGEGAWVGRGSFRTACLAVGACQKTVDAVVDGEEVQTAYVLIRPPGHHAMPDKGMGYCIFNNVAIAARYALNHLGLKRVAIIDWDVHHGNGTQAAFWNDPRVLFVSLHQEELYPSDSGRVEEMGEGDGKGFTVNIPLPAGSGEAIYQLAFDRVISPLLHRYRPELILVSAGQDSGFNEAIGRMCLSSGSFFRLTTRMKVLADSLCGGRLIFIQEGGYNLIFMPFGTMAILEALLGRRSTVEDPVQYWVDRLPPNRSASPDQIAAVERVQNQHNC